MKISAALLWATILLIPTHLWAQSSVWDSWDPDVVSGLNTGEGISYLNNEEQKVILFMNMARHDGPLFAKTFLAAYVDQKQIQKSSYLRSLNRDLKTVSGLPPLMPEADLAAVAQGHATRSGKSGHVGHKDMKKRFAPLRGNPYFAWGENCSYGYEEAIDIVITLLIDDGIKDLGHRKNILNEEFNSVGVAIRPHKNYRVNCVIDFGKKNRSDLNQNPY